MAAGGGRHSGSPGAVAAAGIASTPVSAPGDAEMMAADEGALDPASMTVAEIKSWLTDNEHEGMVWKLTQGKAKKADFVAFMRSVM